MADVIFPFLEYSLCVYVCVSLCVCVCVCAQCVESSWWCVFIWSLLLLQPQPSLIISSEKVSDVPGVLFRVSTASSERQAALLPSDVFLLAVVCTKQILFAVKCISAHAFHWVWNYARREKKIQSASCVSSLAMEAFGPCLSINNHLLQRSFLQ